MKYKDRGMEPGQRAAVLLADDDVELVYMLGEFLADEPIDLAVAYDGKAAASMATRSDFDLLLLDVMLPQMSGFDVLRRVRGVSPVPVIMLTARSAEEDRLEGFELGADDYLCKPFNPPELLARMAAVLRRSRMPPTSPAPGAQLAEVVTGALRVLPASHMAYVGDQAVQLTSAELRILEILARQAGTPVPRERLSTAALGRHLGINDRSLDTHVSNLRRKLAKYADEVGAPSIRALRNLGYMLLASSTE